MVIDERRVLYRKHGGMPALIWQNRPRVDSADTYLSPSKRPIRPESVREVLDSGCRCPRAYNSRSHSTRGTAMHRPVVQRVPQLIQCGLRDRWELHP